jgi:AbrB family looped-hinge helix DNA binding protein
MAFTIRKWYYQSMKEANVQMDRAGRVVLPKTLRDRFHLRGGDMLAIEVKAGAIELRPTNAVGQLKRINGVLVFTAPGHLTNQDFADASREERMDDVLGRATTKR